MLTYQRVSMTSWDSRSASSSCWSAAQEYILHNAAPTWPSFVEHLDQMRSPMETQKAPNMAIFPWTCAGVKAENCWNWVNSLNFEWFWWLQWSWMDDPYRTNVRTPFCSGLLLSRASRNIGAALFLFIFNRMELDQAVHHPSWRLVLVNMIKFAVAFSKMGWWNIDLWFLVVSGLV